MHAHAREHGLTRRESQVLAALCDGLRAKEIAARLEIGEATVRTHLKNVKAKTGCTSVVDIVKQVSRLPPMVPALRQRPHADDTRPSGDDLSACTSAHARHAARGMDRCAEI